MPRSSTKFAASLVLAVCLPLLAFAQGLRSEAAPLTAWLDLRPADPNAAPQTAPEWVEAFEFVPAKKTTDTVASVSVKIGDTQATQAETVSATGTSVYRIRLHRPAAGVNDLQVRIFYDDRASGGRPYLTVWNELGTEIMRSDPIGQGLGLPSSETLLVPMAGADYLEIAAPGDGSQVRAAFLSWLETAEGQRPADFAVKETMAEPFGIQSPMHTPRDDAYQYGVVTARLQGGKPTVLTATSSPAAAYEFQLERQPLVAVVSYEVLGTTLGAAPTLTINGGAPVASETQLPDLKDPAFQGQSHAGQDDMSFRYTGWVRAQKVIPGSALNAGLNRLTLALSSGSDSVAVRSVQIQLKYNWEKLDYTLPPASTPATTSSYEPQ